MLPPDYQERAETYGFTPLDEIRAALEDPDTIVVDVRTPEEIEASGKVEHLNFVQTNCTPSACPALENDPEQFVADKNATVIVYCRSGRRSAKAQQILLSKGYCSVYNAGGYDDIKTIL